MATGSKVRSGDVRVGAVVREGASGSSKDFAFTLGQMGARERFRAVKE